MGQAMDHIFQESEEKKHTCFIYIPKYCRDDGNDEINEVSDKEEEKSEIKK